VEVPQQQPEHGISEDPILLAGLLAGTPIENLIGSIAIHQHALGLPALYLNSGFASSYCFDRERPAKSWNKKF
jgi:hypothetical protein